MNWFENCIKIEGVVFRLDYYFYNEGMRILDFIIRVEGFKEDVYIKRVRIICLKFDLIIEIVNVDLVSVLFGNLNVDIELKREDEVIVYFILDFREEYKVIIDGEVKNSGEYFFYDNLILNDLVV